MIDVSGKVAVITGASRGLGAGLAERFLQLGLGVAACARSRPELSGAQADPPDGSAERIGGRHRRRRGGGVLRSGRRPLRPGRSVDQQRRPARPIGPLRDNDPAEFARHIEVNVLGVFHGSRAFIRHVRARGGEGVLLNISSGAARNAYAGWSAYCAGKAAVDRMSESIALEETARALRVHAVAPGIIDTDMQA
jgi:benzil reductase ((S)-benzoin forming)